MPRSRYTQGFLQTLFASRGISPQRRLGQNFLIDLNLHELIVNAANLLPSDLVLEVGSGSGALTELIATRVARVLAVEIDPYLAKLTLEAVANLHNVEVIAADILARKNAINPDVLSCIRNNLAEVPGKTFKLVANLPYNVATPLVLNLLIDPELCPALLVITIQRELAERMRAKPKTGAYSSLSVVMQALADIEILRILPPTVFWPRPKVESAIVRITPQVEKRAMIADVKWFHTVVRKVFLHRRKNLRRVLYSLWSDHWRIAQVDGFLEKLGLSGMVRAEDLDVEEHISLAHALKAELEQATSMEQDGPAGG
jgi:16S rRNA (adenine1518-N6/adenine1519-N6)-dimethyltransferase